MPDINNMTNNQQSNLGEILGSNTRRKHRGKRMLVAAVSLAAIACAGAYYFFVFNGKPKFTYTYEKVRRGEISELVNATGSVQPTKQVDISSEASGTVATVLYKQNDPIKKGAVLATLNTDRSLGDLQSAEAKLAASRAAVIKAEAELASAEATLRRRKNLIANRVATPQELEQAKYTRDAAAATLEINKASVKTSEAELRLMQVAHEKTNLLSPIDGVVLTRSVEPGATVASSLNAPVLFSIAEDLRRMELRVYVDEADVGKVKEGQMATFTVDAYPQRKFPATIKTLRFAPQVVSNVVTYMAILSVNNDELLLRPGMTATANIVIDTMKDALLIPNAAIRFTPPSLDDEENQQNKSNENAAPTLPKERRIYALRNGVETPIVVQIGISDGRNTAISSDELKVGDLVITDATERS